MSPPGFVTVPGAPMLMALPGRGTTESGQTWGRQPQTSLSECIRALGLRSQRAGPAQPLWLQSPLRQQAALFRRWQLRCFLRSARQRVMGSCLWSRSPYCRRSQQQPAMGWCQSPRSRCCQRHRPLQAMRALQRFTSYCFRQQARQPQRGLSRRSKPDGPLFRSLRPQRLAGSYPPSS